MKKMIAYNSRIFPFLFLILSILVGVVAYFAINELEEYKVLASIFFGVVTFVLFSAFLYTLTNNKIAFEINNEKLTVYKRKNIYTINLSDIYKVKIATNNIGFDCVIYYNDNKKIGMHFLVKNFVKINKQFLQIINDINIKVEFYSL